MPEGLTAAIQATTDARRRSLSIASNADSAQDLYGDIAFGDKDGMKSENTIDGLPREQLKPGTKIDKEAGPYEQVVSIDERDAKCADKWVPRHPALIRLTGKHPFNCEPDPATLMGHGFITPSAMHYVRNHGPVPQLSWDQHKLTVTGLVDRPRTFSMDEIAAMPQTTVLCTLTCAGNRRKEQNMVKKTIGFSWGPAGTACSYWTGVRLSYILRLCGVDEEAEDHHVCFRGIMGELPKGDTSYGTSLPLWKAMWDGSDVIVCWKQNGRLLDPDHGFPVRMIIPGHIGGRMVKWMEEIEVSTQESQNHYHFHDNRVLPSHVEEAQAKEEGWWFKPDFMINELNINSAITAPAHEENQEYREFTKVKGYAYAGGQKIIRCELSLNDGDSWLLADIHRVQHKPNKGGKWWAWVTWEIDVPTGDLLNTREMCCRAWTSDMNTQPNKFTWNLMGMMNNCVYRVKIHPAVKKGMLALRYEHPTIAGTAVGGWMNRADDQPAVVKIDEKAAPKVSGGGRKISMAEVEKHDNKESAWFVRDGLVYDATAFLADHPGGADSILLASGIDASEDFNAIHSTKAKKMLDDYYIGDLDDSAPMPEESSTANGAQAEKKAEGPLIALNPKKKVGFKLLEKQKLSHNVMRFRFALQSPQHRFGLPCGKHVYIYGKADGEAVMRAYTPTSSDDDIGYFDLVIKVYWKDEHPTFPAGGKLSQWLAAQEIGSLVEAKGPVGHFHYLGMGRYTMDGKEGKVSHMSMVGGGTGITPCFAVAKEVLKKADDSVQIRLVYCNQTPEDILLWDELKEMEAKHDNFKVWYTVSGFGTKDNCYKEKDWKCSIGRISQEMFQEHLFPAGEDRLAMFCGPPGMITHAAEPFCRKMGYTDEQIVIF